jgi:hypothetical protein
MCLLLEGHVVSDAPFPPLPDDDRLLDALGSALGADPLPDGLLARCEGLVAFADVDHELAALLDSAGAELAGTRGGTATDVETFELTDGAVTVELTFDRGGVAGQLLGDPVSAVHLETRSGSLDEVPVDELGRFTLPAAAPGPVRLRITTDDGRAVATDWFLL